MHVCKIALKLIGSHRMVILIYVVILSFLGYLMGSSIGSAGDGSYEQVRPTIAVIDRDGSDVSRALAQMVCGLGEEVQVADTTEALQDAAARDLASYVLVIPEGYGEGLLSAARTGTTAPELQTVVSYRSAAGSIADEQVRGWAQRVYALAAATDAPASELTAWATSAQEESAQVEVVSVEQQGLPRSYMLYCSFATYAMLGGIAAVVATGLASLRAPEVRQRIEASRVSGASFTRQVALAIAIAGVAVWAVNALIGQVLLRRAIAGTVWAYSALALTVLLALACVGMAFGFLLWRLGVGVETAHAAGNIESMVLTFLGGTWVSIEQMGEPIRALAQFTPVYWVSEALGKLVDATGVTPALIGSIAADAGIVLLFAAALVAIALALGAARTRAAE